MGRMERKRNRKKTRIRATIRLLAMVAFLAAVTYLAIHFYSSYKNKKLYEDLALSEDTVTEEISRVNADFMQKVKELQQENSDVKGWIRIEGTNINYPLLQGTDNEFYVTHNYKKENSRFGSIFINCNSNIEDVNSNIIIYGHDMQNDTQMFADMLKYKEKEFYEAHPVIRIITEKTDTEYEIIHVFKSRVFYENETNVFRYYHYYNLDSEEIYSEYLRNCKEIELYNTEVIANYGDQLLTLITCEYSQENGRFVIIARKVHDNIEEVTDNTL